MEGASGVLPGGLPSSSSSSEEGREDDIACSRLLPGVWTVQQPRRISCVVQWAFALTGACLVLIACSSALPFRRIRIRSALIPPTEAIQASAKTVSDEFRDLGMGHCINQKGARLEAADAKTIPARTRQDGSSPECAEYCRLHDSCSGYEISGTDCRIFGDAGLLPSASDGAAGSRCFWRHRFVWNSSDLDLERPRPIPKVIWSYWRWLPKQKSPPDATSKGFCAMPAGRPCVFPFTFLGTVHTSCTTAYSDPSDQDGDNQTDDGAAWCGTLREVQGGPGEWGPCGPCPTETSQEAQLALRSFMDICMSTWRKLNPNYEVRLLDDKSVWDWLQKDDLPAAYQKLSIQHKSDAIRLSLLAKYGGVWVDASTLLLKPLSKILGTDSPVRTFFSLPTPWTPPALIVNDRRVNHLFHVENWFLAAPPNDTLITRTRTCVFKFLSLEIKNGTLETSGLFSEAQLEMLARVGAWEYLSTDACIFKTLDEDVALRSWWLSPLVRRINPVAITGAWWLADMQRGRRALFGTTNATLLRQLLDEDFYMFKFTGDMRAVLVQGLTMHELWCKENTFHKLLKSIGVGTTAMCHIRK